MQETATKEAIGHNHAVYASDLNFDKLFALAQRNTDRNTDDIEMMELVLFVDIKQLDTLKGFIHPNYKDLLVNPKERQAIIDAITERRSFALWLEDNHLKFTR